MDTYQKSDYRSSSKVTDRSINLTLGPEETEPQWLYFELGSEAKNKFVHIVQCGISALALNQSVLGTSPNQYFCVRESRYWTFYVMKLMKMTLFCRFYFLNSTRV